MYNCCPDDEHMNKNELTNYLIDLGFGLEQASVYLNLIEKGEATPLSISRDTGINRTKVYRLIEEMSEKKLLTQEIGKNTTKVAATPIDQLKRLLADKQSHLELLSLGWKSVEELLGQMALEKKSETRVKFYHGKTGIEQMVWNVLKASGEIVGYTFRDLSHFVGDKFMKEFAYEFRRRNLKMRDIHGDEYLASLPIDNAWGSNMNSRYLSKNILAIPHQTDIFDDVVSFYSWNEGEVWGSEIYNPKVAQMQKQLFELAWEKAKKI